VTLDKTVLNVGCGSGTTTTYIVENFGCNVVGVDIKENMGESAINWSKRKGLVDQTEFRFAGAQDLPFENDFFDNLIFESINIFVHKKKVKAFTEYKRVVKLGGAIGLNEPILTKAPPPNAAELLADYVGHDILPASYWLGLMEKIGLSELTSKEYPVEIRKESRS